MHDQGEGRRVAIVVVTWNSAGVLPGLLASLPAAMTGVAAWSVTAVDNASSDDTWQLLLDSPTVDTVVAMGRNAGYAAAVNAAAERLPLADALLVLNPDVRPRPGMAAALLSALERSGAGIAVPALENRDGSLAYSLRREPTLLRALGEAAVGGHRSGRVSGLGEVVVDSARYRRTGCVDWASGAAWLISRQCLDAVGRWEESYFLYGEETDFALRARDAGFAMRFVPEARATHIGGDAPVSPRLWSLLQVNRVRLIRQRRGRSYAAVYRMVLLINAALRAMCGRDVHRAALIALLRPQAAAVARAGGQPAPPPEVAAGSGGRGAQHAADAGSAAAPGLARRDDARPSRASRRSRRMLMIVQNLPVPFDRRVWLEAQALVAAGIGVSVICPRGPKQRLIEELEGVRLYRYPAPPPTAGRASYFFEFGYCWLATATLSLLVRLRDGFSVIQACNPPDTYFALAALYKPLGVRFVYDQHDLCPEVFQARFGTPGSPLHRALLGLERLTYRTADRVIATNESYRRTALTRGGKAPEAVTIVRNGPDLDRLQPGPARPQLRQGRAHLLCYLGVMGPQDGVDGLLRAVAVLVHEMGRRDLHVALLGFGDMLSSLKALSEELEISPWVTFTGRADTAMVIDYLSTASVGLCPDPKDPFNDASTMNKTMEYMAFGLPIVSYDLTETRVSAGNAAVYVEEHEPRAFAKTVDALLDDPDARARMGAAGRERVEERLAWVHQVPAYVEVYRELLAER